jgi:ABC-type dipeptide/oligopeptide/nickel transport system ATPase component
VQAQILDVLDRATNTAIVMITHDLGVIARIAVAQVMYAGRRGTTTVHELFDHPTHPYTGFAVLDPRHGESPRAVGGHSQMLRPPGLRSVHVARTRSRPAGDLPELHRRNAQSACIRADELVLE